MLMVKEEEMLLPICTDCSLQTRRSGSNYIGAAETRFPELDEVREDDSIECCAVDEQQSYSVCSYCPSGSAEWRASEIASTVDLLWQQAN